MVEKDRAQPATSWPPRDAFDDEEDTEVSDEAEAALLQGDRARTPTAETTERDFPELSMSGPTPKPGPDQMTTPPGMHISSLEGLGGGLPRLDSAALRPLDSTLLPGTKPAGFALLSWAENAPRLAVSQMHKAPTLVEEPAQTAIQPFECPDDEDPTRADHSEED